MKYSYKNNIYTGLVYLLLTVMAIIAVFPLIWIILSSIKPSSEMSSNPLSFIPKVGKKMTKMLITTYMFPTILLAVPYVTVMAKLGLINTWIGVVITYLSFSIPYAIWMLIGFFQTVPIGIEEAAKVDGVGKFGIFFQIVLPIVSPGIVSTAIYTFINTWNEFLYALLLINNSEKMPLSIALYSLTGSEILDWGQMMAASVIVILPSIVFFMIIQNKIAGGLSDGSVK